jgi:anti-sigma factor RsiW
MRHPDDDTLLKHILELLDPNERGRLLGHLDDCAACRERHAEMERETRIIGGIEPGIPVPPVAMPDPREAGTLLEAGESEPPLDSAKAFSIPDPGFKPRRAPRWRFARIAALLLVGFAAGIGFSRAIRPADVVVVPRGHTGSVPAISLAQFVVCESFHLEVP